MEIISNRDLLLGSDSVFCNWSGYEIPVKGLSMAETQEVVERFEKKGAQHGPMRSFAAQLAADMVQEVVKVGPSVLVGAREKPGTSQRHYWDSKVPSPGVAVLADINIFDFDAAINRAKS